MSLTDELQKLSALHRAGQLSDAEFVAAKKRLLEAGEPEANPAPEAESDVTAPIGFKERTYYSSRWSKGNLFFRDRLVVASDGMVFRKARMFGSSEEHISYRSIASYRVANGVFLANLCIETSGGTQPIFVNGLWKSDAKQIQDYIRLGQMRP